MRSRIVAIPGIVVALAVLLLYPGAAGVPASELHPLTLFGPESFERGRNAPLHAERTFQAPSGLAPATLHVAYGEGARGQGGSTVFVKVNGRPVVRNWRPGAKRTTRLDVPLRNLVKGGNRLSVELYGKPGSRFTVSVTADYPLDIAIRAPAAGSVIYSDRATVVGTFESYSPLVAIAVNGIEASVSGTGFAAVDVPLASGSNALTATIRTSEGISDFDTVSVSANLPPTAEAGRDRVAMTGTAVPLDGRDSFDPEGDLIRYRWDLVQYPDGGGLAAAGGGVLENPESVTPTLIPPVPGSYLISLVVNDGHSESPPDTVQVTAEHPNVAPTANAGADQSVTWGSQVFLNGSGSFDPDGNPLTYLWEFLSIPAGSAAALDDPSSPAPVFVADAVGSYVVGLTVGDGLADSLQDTVTVLSAAPNAPPVAWAGDDQTVDLGTTIRLDGSGSTDPENGPLSYEWSIVSKPPASGAILDNAVSSAPTIPADASGEFVFRLKVSDGAQDSAPDTVVVTVNAGAENGRPVADAGPDLQVPLGVAFALSGGGSRDPDGDPLTYRWSIAGAPFGSAAALVDPTSPTPTFTPDLVGAYEIMVIVNDGVLDSAPDTAIVWASPVVTVPTVAGYFLRTATSRIQSAGLSVGAIDYESSATVPDGYVIRQNPAGGQLALEGSPVDLVVSAGP